MSGDAVTRPQRSVYSAYRASLASPRTRYRGFEVESFGQVRSGNANSQVVSSGGKWTTYLRSSAIVLGTAYRVNGLGSRSASDSCERHALLSIPMRSSLPSRTVSFGGWNSVGKRTVKRCSGSTSAGQ